LQDSVFRATEDILNGGAGKLADQSPPGDTPKHVIVTQGDSLDAATDQGWADVSNNGFDFRKLGH
jgi:hypothetical protein